ncbi:DUF6538 domain-containing protein, partial [Sphingobium sp. D43FB]|uniref:DUF6538 domain-containing protein n=1 Tax=Sphingobium sp. D43FB TaxID=2017595 RepID=UPI001C3EB1AA
VVQIIDQIEGEAGDDGVEMMGMDAGSRKPAKATRQSPATRSSPPQTPENQRKPAKKWVTSRVWDTKVGHNDPSKMGLTSSKQTEYLSSSWVTTVGHKRWPRGLSMRGSIYQFRVRVPADLRPEFGCSHLKRSLRTDSPSLAVKLGRRMASEIDALTAV